MKLLAYDRVTSTRIIAMTDGEWGELLQYSSVPNDKRSGCNEVSLNVIERRHQAIIAMKDLRSELGRTAAKWDKLASVIDEVLDK
jgi:hypothetical protein